MPRPIDGDAFARDLEISADSLRVTWEMDRHEMFTKRNTYREIADRLRKAPTIDYEPVRHGEWDDKIVPFCNVCSVCKVFVDRGCFPTVRHKGCLIPNIGELKYCPNCGAKMDGGKENDKP